MLINQTYMEGFLITHKCMGDIAALELKELIGKGSKIFDSGIDFEIVSYGDLFKLCYMAQSAIGVYYLLHKFDFNDILEDFSKNIQNIDFSEWLSPDTQFRVKCIKGHDNDTPTQEIEEKLGEIIIDYIQKKYRYKQKVNLNNPEIIISFYLSPKKCYVGIDFAGFDLSKRPYKLFSDPSAVKGTIGYALVRLSGYNKNETLLDCFSGSGVVSIEAALFASGFPVNFYYKEKFIFLKFHRFNDYNFNKLFKKIDKVILDNKLKIHSIDISMKYVNYARKNSKIAGIDKIINFSRADLEWLDTKFEKGKIDKIVTKLPSSQKNEASTAENIYNSFFYQAEFILNDNGKIALIGDKEMVKKYSAKYKFKISAKRSIFSGKKEYEIFILGK